MPRPRLSSVERRQRQTVRTARWRSRIAARQQALGNSGPFIIYPASSPQHVAVEEGEGLTRGGEEDDEVLLNIQLQASLQDQEGTRRGDDLSSEQIADGVGYESYDDNHQYLGGSDNESWQQPALSDQPGNRDRGGRETGAGWQGIDSDESDNNDAMQLDESDDNSDVIQLDNTDTDASANSDNNDDIIIEQEAGIREREEEQLLQSYSGYGEQLLQSDNNRGNRPSPLDERESSYADNISQYSSSSSEVEGNSDSIDGESPATAEQVQDRSTTSRTLSAETDEADETNFAYELAYQLFHFQGCGKEQHTYTLAQHDTLFSQPAHRHTTLVEHTQQIASTGIPRVFEKDTFLSTREREGYVIPDWQLAFEGRLQQGNGAREQAGPGRIGGDEEAEDEVEEEAEDEDEAEEEEEAVEAHSEEEARDAHPDEEAREAHSDEEARDAHLEKEAEDEVEEEEEAVKLCLSCSQYWDSTADISFDIDSFLGFAESLAFAKEGLTISLFPRFHTNIQTNLHIDMLAYYNSGRGERQLKAQLHTIPHYQLGRVFGHEDIAVYIFFPHMYDPEKKTNFPGKGGGQAHNLLRVWTDKIILPALFRHCPASSRQHLPPSWEQARYRACAYYQERRSGPQEEVITQALSLHYFIQPDILAAIWQDIEEALAQPRYRIYSGAQLFFSSKNTKLRFKSATVAGCWDSFNTSISGSLDPDYLEPSRTWIDLGKETAGTGYALPGQQPGPESAPTTYLLRTCCQEAFARWANFDLEAGSVKATFYKAAMLRDICELTLEMSRLSPQRRQGWLFSQSYNSYKEMYDAAKTKPFSSPFLGRLSWDPLVAKMLKQQGKAPSVPVPHIKRGYLKSKTRLFDAFQSSRGLSYGVREEHRISVAFFYQLETALQASGHWDTAPTRTPADYEYIWKLTTANYTAYLDQNTNKYLAAIEWILSSDPKGQVSYDHCQVVGMLLQALPFTFDSGPVKDKSEIWKESLQRRRGGARVLGMGLTNTCNAAGYAWLLPRIDWEQLAFRRRLGGEMAFTSSMLHDAYRRNWAGVVDAKDDLGRVEAAGKWLDLFGEEATCKEFVIDFLLVLLMRAYRKEVFRHLKNIILPEHQEAASQGKIMLCLESLSEVLNEERFNRFHIINPPNTKIRTTKDLVAFIWGLNDKVRRDRWENAPFRVLYQKALQHLEDRYGKDERLGFSDQVERYFIATNWLIPHSSATKFIQKDRDKDILWTAVFHRRIAYSAALSHQVVPASWLLKTTLPHPTVYRPERRFSADFISKLDKKDSRITEYHYMEDWSLVRGNDGPFMPVVPEDIIWDNIELDADPKLITETLQAFWEYWRQVEGLGD